MTRAARLSLARRVLPLVAALGAWLGAPDRATAQAVMSTPGEFRVTESGAAAYSIPITVPPGVAGMEPKLAINFNSHGGNGRLGIAFGIEGFSSITRCGRTLRTDAVNTGILYTADDKLCLDGQRLVKVSDAVAYLTAGSKYRTERESYSKITAVGTTPAGVESFIVKTKSGLTMEYGATTDSRIEAQGKTQVAAWFLSKVRDTKGNTMSFTYTEDNSGGDAYPLKIEYGGNDGSTAARAHSRTVSFEYATRADVNEPRYVAGAKVNTINRLTKVKTLIGTNPVAEYLLTYENSAAPNNASRLVAVEQCGYTGATTTQCLPKTTFTWQLASGGGYVGSAGFGGAVAAGDFDGNGYSDILTWDGFAHYSLGPNTWNNPTSQAVPGRTCTTIEGTESCTAYYAASGDFNGDGKADLIVNGLVYLSNGTTFTLATSFANRGTGPVAAGDFNGDGYADVIVNGVVSFSSGSGWSSTVSIGPGTACVSSEWGGACYDLGVAAGDFNGDGRADVFLGGSVYLSSGTTFAYASSFGTLTTVMGYMHSHAAAGDFNGDGYADLLFAGNIKFSNGINWTSSSYYSGYGVYQWSDDWGSYTSYHPTPVGDYDGDGRIDIASMGGLNQTSSTSLPNAVTKIAPGIGADIEITYKPLSDATAYTQESGAVWPIRDVLKHLAMRVVSEVATSSGLGTGTLKTNYAYGGARTDVKGWGTLGFRWMETVDVASSIKTRTEFSQTWPYFGLTALVSRTKAGAGCTLGSTSSSLSRVETTLAKLEQGSNYGSTGSNYRYMPYVSQTIQQTCDLNGALLPVVTVKNAFDDWGNAKWIAQHTAHPTETADAYWSCKITENTYIESSTYLNNWLLGRLLSAKVTMRSGATDAAASACVGAP
jgi:hypothetical protein